MQRLREGGAWALVMTVAGVAVGGIVLITSAIRRWQFSSSALHNPLMPISLLLLIVGQVMALLFRKQQRSRQAIEIFANFGFLTSLVILLFWNFIAGTRTK